MLINLFLGLGYGCLCCIASNKSQVFLTLAGISWDSAPAERRFSNTAVFTRILRPPSHHNHLLLSLWWQNEVKLWIDQGTGWNLETMLKKSRGKFQGESSLMIIEHFKPILSLKLLYQQHTTGKNLIRDFKSNTVGPETFKDEKKFNLIYFSKGY